MQGIIDAFSGSSSAKIIDIPGKSIFASFDMDIDNAREELGYEPEYA